MLRVCHGFLIFTRLFVYILTGKGEPFPIADGGQLSSASTPAISTRVRSLESVREDNSAAADQSLAAMTGSSSPQVTLGPAVSYFHIAAD